MKIKKDTSILIDDFFILIDEFFILFYILLYTYVYLDILLDICCSLTYRKKKFKNKKIYLLYFNFHKFFIIYII